MVPSPNHRHFSLSKRVCGAYVSLISDPIDFVYVAPPYVSRYNFCEKRSTIDSNA